MYFLFLRSAGLGEFKTCGIFRRFIELKQLATIGKLSGS
jgi:hypothetical protein